MSDASQTALQALGLAANVLSSNGLLGCRIAANGPTIGEFIDRAVDELDAKPKQPTITGYRELSAEETMPINAIKALGVELEGAVANLRNMPAVDQRWVSIGATDLQTGLMALTRAIARPTTF